MFHISESQPVSEVPLSVFDLPDATWKRFTSGMVTTSPTMMSFAWIASWFRFAGSVSLRS